MSSRLSAAEIRAIDRESASWDAVEKSLRDYARNHMRVVNDGLNSELTKSVLQAWFADMLDELLADSARGDAV